MPSIADEIQRAVREALINAEFVKIARNCLAPPFFNQILEEAAQNLGTCSVCGASTKSKHVCSEYRCPKNVRR